MFFYSNWAILGVIGQALTILVKNISVSNSKKSAKLYDFRTPLHHSMTVFFELHVTDLFRFLNTASVDVHNPVI